MRLSSKLGRSRHVVAVLAFLPAIVWCSSFDSSPAPASDGGVPPDVAADVALDVDLRADGGVPEPAMTDCAFWFRADEGVLASADKLVARWDSRCPSGAIASLAPVSTAERPRTSSMGGRPAVSFRAIDQAALNGPTLQADPVPTFGAPLSIYVAFSLDQLYAAGANVLAWRGGTGFGLAVGVPNRLSFQSVVDNVTQSLTEVTIRPAPANYVVLVEAAGGTTNVYLDDPNNLTSTTLDGSATTSATGLVLGGGEPGNGIMMGDVAEVIAYRHLQDEGERKAVFAYLHARYGP